MLYTNVSVMFYTTTCNKGDGLAYFVDNDNSNDNGAFYDEDKSSIVWNIGQASLINMVHSYGAMTSPRKFAFVGKQKHAMLIYVALSDLVGSANQITGCNSFNPLSEPAM